MSKKVTRIPTNVMIKVTNLNCDNSDSVRRLKKSLNKLPIIKSEADLETDQLDKIINNLSFKHDINLNHIMKSVGERGVMNSAMFKDNQGSHISTVHGKSLWELLAKATFYMFYYITKDGETDGS